MRFLPLFVFGAVLAVAGSQTFPLSIDEIRVRDPFVYADPDTKLYYLYAQTGNRRMDPQTGLRVEVYRSRDLTNWSEPTLAAFHIATVRNRFWVRWTTPAFSVLSRMKFVCQLDMNRSA